MERSTMFNGKINYFDWAISNSYVKLPEGSQRVLTHISIYIHILNQLLVPLPQMGAHWNFRYTYTGCAVQTLVSTSKQVLVLDVYPLQYALYIISLTPSPCWEDFEWTTTAWKQPARKRCESWSGTTPFIHDHAEIVHHSSFNQRAVSKLLMQYAFAWGLFYT